MGKSSLFVSFMRVVQAIVKIAPQIVKWPDEAQRVIIKEEFYRKSRLRNVIGAIDGTFIVIKAPKNHPEVFKTRKCNYAMTLQAVCDPFLKFTDGYVSYPGSVSDTRIFKKSVIYNKINENRAQYFSENEFIVGDKAYPNLSWCMSPFIRRRILSENEERLNVMISKARNPIERSFALLFGRFRRLQYLNVNITENVPAVTIAAMVLHNICLNNDDPFLSEYIADGQQEPNDEIIEDEIFGDEIHEEIDRRRILIDQIFVNNE